MKKLVYLSMLLVLVLGTVTVAAQAPQKPALPDRAATTGKGVDNVTGSTVNTVTPAFLPTGVAFDLCFNVTNTSNDAEYMDGFDFQVPANWAVNSVTDVPGDGCGNGHTYGVDANNKVFWYTNGMPTGCGDWYYGTRDFCANVTIPSCDASPWDLAWNIIGDTWGSPPHSVAGVWSAPCEAAALFLTPAEQSGTACEDTDITYTLSLYNHTGAAGTFDLGYASNWAISGPASVYADIDQSVSFDVAVTVPCGGQDDTATVTADGNGFSDSAALFSTVSTGGWQGAWALETNAGAIPQQWGSCAVNNDMGYYISGLDAAGGVQNAFQQFDGAAFAQLPAFPQALFGTVAGWINGKLYVAGGGDADFTGYTSLWIWDGASWTSGAAMPAPRLGGGGGAAPCFGGAGTCLWYAGGTPDGYFTDFSFNVYEFNPATNIWTQRSSIPGNSGNYGQALGGGTVCNGKVYFGGDYRGIADWFALDPVTDTWTQLAAIPAAAGKMTPAVTCGPDNNVYFIGGDSLGAWGDTYNQKVFQYSVAGNAWTQMAQSINQGLLGSCATFFNGKLYTFGGTNGSYAINPAPHESLGFFECEGCEPPEDTLTCGGWWAQPAIDPYGRIYLRWKVEAIDQDGAPVGFVAVTANLTSPEGGPFTRTRWSHWDGIARFPWGSHISGLWTIDVTNMVLDGYTFLDGANCSAQATY